MKRITAIALLLLICSAFFVGCSKEEDSTVTCRDCGIELNQDDSYVRRGRYFCMDCYYGEVK